MEERMILFFSVVLFTQMAFSVPTPQHHGPIVPASEAVASNPKQVLKLKTFVKRSLSKLNVVYTCSPPPNIPYAILEHSGDNLLGSVRRYKCLDTHIATGPIEIICVQGTGGPLWTSSESKCISRGVKTVSLQSTNLTLDR